VWASTPMVLIAFSLVAKGNLSFLVRLHGAQSPEKPSKVLIFGRPEIFPAIF
jgi:hypothetical protein